MNISFGSAFSVVFLIGVGHGQAERWTPVSSKAAGSITFTQGELKAPMPKFDAVIEAKRSAERNSRLEKITVSEKQYRQKLAMLAKGARNHPAQLTRLHKEFELIRPAFSPDGRFLATCTRKELVVWDLSTGAEYRRRKGPKDGFSFVSTKLCFTPDGNRLVFPFDKNLEVWDLKEDRIVKAIPLQKDLLDFAISADGKSIALCESVYAAGKVVVLDMQTLKKKYEIPSDSILGVAFSPNGDTLAARGLRVTIYQADTGREIAFLRLKNGADHVAFSPDGWTLAIASTGVADQGKLVLWNLAQNAERTFDGFNTMRYAAFSPDGKVIICNDGKQQFRDSSSGKTLRVAELSGGDVLYSPGGELLVSPLGSVYATDAVMKQDANTP